MFQFRLRFRGFVFSFVVSGHLGLRFFSFIRGFLVPFCIISVSFVIIIILAQG